MSDPSRLSSSADSHSGTPAFTAPQISMPKGGGAIRGIGEKVNTNAVTGTASLTIPVSLSAARSAFNPQLSLNYDSASGNDAFGLGWTLSCPSITRKTDKGLPQYRDTEESDVFILSGSEDLVPVLDGGSLERDGYRIDQYRPRVEALFARIERRTRIEDGDVHWCSFSADNVLTIYGSSPESRIADPENPRHIFRWLTAASYDDRGNAIVYRYAAEDGRGVDVTVPQEQNRSRTANRYVKRILYGNRKPMRGPCSDDDAEWMFEAVFDYGDEDYRPAEPDREGRTIVAIAEEGRGDWLVRADPFSTYRSGFEVRTYRLCRRMLMFHRFAEELGTPRYLVQSFDLAYREEKTGSFITSITHSGYSLVTGNHYLKKTLPALELDYSVSPLEDEHFQDFELRDAEHENLPAGIDGAHYRWLDLDGEGIPGVLTEQHKGWYYKHNLGNGRFGPMQLVSPKPSLGDLQSGNQQLLDVAGSGSLNLVELDSSAPGFYERTKQAEWGLFRSFQSVPVLDWNDPNLRFVDVTGDGIADVLVTEDAAFQWHPSLLAEGFGEAVRIPSPHTEREGPRVVFADQAQSIYLADMSGDGLSDIVRIRNGEVCYWPNLGYGKFGAKITMGRSPRFDEPDQFDQKRIRLTDTDGSGTADLLYLGAKHIHIYLNRSGNEWSSVRRLRIPADDFTAISVTDFLGRGTACVVWSSPLPAESGRPLRYVDLMRGQKPHLLTRVRNNLGAETAIEYATSTEFYLADLAAGRPWITRLPFPVHVVRSVETYDYVSRSRFVTRSTYHHGYFDPSEREFRGFGLVEQTDTEAFDRLKHEGAFSPGANESAAFDVPPVLTKKWFHTGVFLNGTHISRQMAHEYYREPATNQAMLLEDTILPHHLTPEEAREACRALKGSVLRQEVYSLDGTGESGRPYTVAESNFTIQMLQPRGPNRHAVFFTHARESVSFNYERKLYDIGGTWRADPRVTHSLTLEVDDYGNVLKSVKVTYGRRFPDLSNLLTDEDRRKQEQLLLSLTENGYTNPVRAPEMYRNPLPAETRTYELIRVKPEANCFGTTHLFGFDEMRQRVVEASDGSHHLPYEDLDARGARGNHPYRRVLQRTRMVYRSDDLQCLLPLGQLESRALPGESYKLAFTPGQVATVYRREKANHPPENLLPAPAAVLAKEGGYRDLDCDGHWWISSGRVFYSSGPDDAPAAELAYARQHFFLPHRFRDPFGNTTAVVYDKHDLAVIETRDAAGNTTKARTDYRVLAPKLVIDANGNRSEVAFDALGMVAGSALMGKEGEDQGDSLEGFVADLSDEAIRAHLRNPLENPWEILGKATARLVYDLFAFANTRSTASPLPSVTYTLARETHESELSPGERSRIRHSFSYSDGFGRTVQQKVQAEPGPDVDPRWAGTGWTIFNNKGMPVRQFEPFFSATQEFEFAISVGVSSTLFYDPLSRVVATLHPEHTYEKVVFDPWRTESWDVNDTTLEADPACDPDVGAFFSHLPPGDDLPTWYEQRRSGALGPEAKDAAEKTAVHARTPKIAYFDTLGRSFLSIDHNRFQKDEALVEQFLPTRVELDIQGRERWRTDALLRRICSFDYNVSGSVIHLLSRDSGERWSVNDISGKPILTWDGRDHRFRYSYDSLRRQTGFFIEAGGEAEKLAEKIVYGEGQPDDIALNLRGRIFQSLDGAGIAANGQFDFKGNLLSNSRRLLRQYKHDVDWSASPELDERVFTSRTTFDALNRPVVITTPDSSVIRPGYNEASLLETVHVNLRGAAEATSFVRNINYNAKGQREFIEYGNEARTSYAYDSLTFRLVQLKTWRSTDDAILQDLSYTYDPAGNISSIGDRAQQTVYFDNQVVGPRNDYVYDALYRLIGAHGREHIGLLMDSGADSSQAPDPDPWQRMQPLPGDGQAMRRYRERYEYDAVGNILELIHSASGQGCRRHYTYPESSNRLEATRVGEHAEHYRYDPNGNMTRMPHLAAMDWDFKNELRMTQTRVVNDGPGERTYYVYNSAGERVRKITERADGAKAHERIYLGGFEIYREYHRGAVALERETLHVMDDKRRIALVETKTVDADAPPGTQPTVLMRYQFTNHLESSCLELDDKAAIISYEEYYPYGSTSYAASEKRVEVSKKRYRYLGKERDEETGFYYCGARYYASWLGRWSSPDPKGMVDGVNLYAYCRDNPVTMRDPNGTDGETSMAEDEAQACLVDPSIPAPTALEEERQQSIPSEHPAASQAATPAPRPAAPRPSQGGETITPPPPVSPTDMSLYVDHGIVWQQYTAALEGAADSDNPWWARGTLGVLAIAVSPLAGAEEYIGRPISNIPFVMENAGIGIGEHIGRAELWAEQGEYGEATVDSLEAVTAFSKGFVAGASVAAPVAGAVDSQASSTALNEVSSSLETATTEETVSVYHGSIKNGSEILENGLSVEKAPTFVSRDLAAAQDALVNHPDAIPGEGMIIESRIPASDFNSTLAPLERPYTGFYPNELQSTEITLRTAEHIDLFNQYMCR